VRETLGKPVGKTCGTQNASGTDAGCAPLWVAEVFAGAIFKVYINNKKACRFLPTDFLIDTIDSGLIFIYLLL